MDLALHEKLCKDLHELCIAKNKRYGDSFSKTIQKYGPVAALVRMEDKWNRIEELIQQKATPSTDESLEDTLIDLANYSLMTVCELRTKAAQSIQNTAAATAASSSIPYVVNPSSACVDTTGYAGPMAKAYDTYRKNVEQHTSDGLPID